MIPQPAIKQWQERFSWQKDYQIEQDLIICRAVCALFSDEYLAEHLAFRGGTAFNKLYLHPQPRYSEDIDLVQINAEPIKETIDKIREVLSFLGEPKVKQKAHNNTLIFRLYSEIPPIIPIRLKVEINTREHFNVLGLTQRYFSVDSHRLCEIARSVTCRFRAQRTAAPTKSFTSKRSGKFVAQTFILSVHETHFASAHANIACGNVRIRSDVTV